MFIRRLLTLLTLFTLSAASADDLIRDYARLPHIRDVTISPDGRHYAFIQRREEQDYFVVVNIAEKRLVGGANASKLKARNIYFATNNHVILKVSETRAAPNIRGKWEQDAAASYQIDSGELKVLLRNYDELYPAQSGLSRIVGVNLEDNEVYIPAFVGRSQPRMHLLKVNLNTGRGRLLARGRTTTKDWFVTDKGKVLAREDFNTLKRRHQIFSYESGKPKLVYEEKTDIPSISINAVTADGRALVFIDTNDLGDAIFTMSLADGRISEAKFQQTERDIDATIRKGLNREFLGVRVSGVVPLYDYVDEALNDSITAAKQVFGNSSIYPVSATHDLSKIVFEVSGNYAADDYFIYDRQSNSASRIAKGYPAISKAQLGTISAIRYPARDGEKISAILTWPTGIQKETLSQPLPTLVFPHGGPESYDRISFDWWAQYFARQGYLVFQPNFRGSTGFGNAFRDAGRGKWGRLMQDDITDGVNVLIESGYADSNKICIMGASYGGYAALAGGAFTPELYRCVIAVAGVSDLPRMLQDEKRFNDSNNWGIKYWEKLIGNTKRDKEHIKSISPVFAADQFTAPVLLVHGKDDTVVRLNQSQRMSSALRKADKSVKMVTLKGEDHWLSGSKTRVAMLGAIAEFLAIHNPATPPG